MQIAVSGVNGHFLTHQSAQGRSNRRRFRIPHAGVANQCIFSLQLLRIGFEKRLQRRRAGFLFTLEQYGDLHRQRAYRFLVGAAGFQKCQQLPLVIRCAASGNDLTATIQLLDRWRERIIFPKLQRIDRLNIVMTVKQHMRRIGAACFMVRNHHRVAGRLPHRCRKSKISQHGNQPLRRLGAIGLVGGIGGD